MITIITIVIGLIQIVIVVATFLTEIKFSRISNSLERISKDYAKKSFELSQKYGECDFDINLNNFNANQSSNQQMSVSNTESDRKGITIAFNKEFDVKNGTLKKMLLYSKMDLNS